MTRLGAFLALAVLLAACAVPTPNVEVSGGSASPTRWRVGIPF